MNKIVIAGGVATALVLIGYLASSDEKVKKEVVEKVKLTEDKGDEKKVKKIEILYLDESSDKKEQQTQHYTTSTTPANPYKDKLTTGEDIIEYINENNLVNITPKKIVDGGEMVPTHSVYADVTPQEAKALYDSSFPPPAPAIVSGKTSDGNEYSLIIDGYVNAVATKKVVTSNSEDGEIIAADNLSPQKSEELNNKSSEEAKIIAPPAIGQ